MLMKKFTYGDENGELDEQDAAPSGDSGGGGTTYPTVTKWETGLARSVANTLDDIKEEEKQHETNVRDELALKDIVKKTVSVLMVISREP